MSLVYITLYIILYHINYIILFHFILFYNNYTIPRLKVSEIEADGCVPLSQTHFAKRGVAESVPVVDMDWPTAFKALCKLLESSLNAT